MHLKIILLADKPDTLASGLMFTEPLRFDECAFFIFKYTNDYSFWNKNVSYPISLFFLDENFKIQNIGKLEANQEQPCWSNYPLTKYVVEGHHLLPKEYDIQIGDYCIPEDNKINIIKGKHRQ